MTNDAGSFRSEADCLIRMREEDSALRQSLLNAGELAGGCHPRMEAMHRSHAEVLREIIARIGYPTVRKVGAEASNAAWLIVQHAIGEPDFMREIRALLRTLSPEDADPRNAAFLEDRIRMYEGRPQLYGTQFDFDDSGVLSPVPFDDREAVNRRRAALGMNSLEERTEEIRHAPGGDRMMTPEELDRYRIAYRKWLEVTGWRKPS